MTRIGLAGLTLMASLALVGCDDPKPGLEDEVRVEKVVDCKSVIGHFAPTEAKKGQLCECTTARLAQEGLTVADLSGAKRDRAMEQLRWCIAQIGLGPKASKPAAESSETPDDEATVDPGSESAAQGEASESALSAD